MSIIRDENQARLAKLGSYGSELVERYRYLLESDVFSTPTYDLLQSILFERDAMIDRLIALQRARGELPKAGDPERVFLHSIADWAQDNILSDSEGIVRRLREADKEWLELIDEALELEWGRSERRTLETVREHVVNAYFRLGSL